MKFVLESLISETTEQKYKKIKINDFVDFMLTLNVYCDIIFIRYDYVLSICNNKLRCIYD